MHSASMPARFWPADVHVIGKDISRFHAIYWPAFLMSAGIELPKRVMIHGFLHNNGVKMSKSLGNVVAPADFVAQYGLDQVRFFFLREVPFGADGSYNHEAIVGRMNSDLANNFGNLAQRSLSMVAKNCEGRVPVPGAFTAEDTALLAQANGLLDAARAAFEKQEFSRALEAIWGRLAPHVTGAYANFLASATEEDVAAIYPRKTYQRLATVKRRYDSGNLFARNHNVRPE